MEDYSIAAYIYGMNCIFVDHSPCSSVVIVSANDTGSYNPSTSALNDDYFGPYTMAWSGSEPELDSNGNPRWENGDYAIWWYNETWNIGEKLPKDINDVGMTVALPAKPTFPIKPVVPPTLLKLGNMSTLTNTPCPYTTRDQVIWKYKNIDEKWIGDTSDIVTTGGMFQSLLPWPTNLNLVETSYLSSPSPRIVWVLN